MNNYAFTTLLATDDYLWGAVGLYYSLKRVNSQYPFHLLITDNLSPETVIKLDEIGITYTIVPRIDFIKQEDRYPLTFNKFYIYSLKQYDAVCFIDCDALVRTNIDDIFSLQTPGFIVINNSFLSGILVLINPQSKNFCDFETYRQTYRSDEWVWNKAYDPSKVTNLIDYFPKLIHRSDLFTNDDKYWKYYQLNSENKIKNYIWSEHDSNFQLTQKAYLIAENKMSEL